MPSERTHHGDTFVDEYAWLADKENPETIAYLEAQNAYTEALTAHQAGLRDDDLRRDQGPHPGDRPVGAVPQGRLVVLRPHGRGQAVRGAVPLRGPRPATTTPPLSADGGPLAGEQVLLDANELAEGHEFFSLGAFDVSPDGRCWRTPPTSRATSASPLRVKDLATGELLADEIPDTFYGGAWSADGPTLFYVTVDEAWRPDRVWRHVLGTPAADDVVVYQETDERFWVGVGLTRSERSW